MLRLFGVPKHNIALSCFPVSYLLKPKKLFTLINKKNNRNRRVTNKTDKTHSSHRAEILTMSWSDVNGFALDFRNTVIIRVPYTSV